MNRNLSGGNRLLKMFLLALGLVLATTAAVSVEQQAPISLSATAGFDGFYKGNLWLPVYVTVANTGPAVEARVQIATGSSTSGNQVVYTSPVSLPTQSSKRLILYVYVSNLVDRLTVELVDDENRVLAATETNSLDRLDLADLLYGVVTSTPGVLDVLEDVTAGRPEAAVAYLRTDMLPSIPAALNALDVLVLHDVDSGNLDGEQLAALVSWIGAGGQLVVSGGPGWRKTATALSDLLPVSISGTRAVEDLPDLAADAGLPFRDPGPYLVTNSSLRSGTAILRQNDRPLLAAREIGRGLVYFLALDPALAPLIDWQGSLHVWNEVASRLAVLPPWALGAQNSYAAASAVSSLPSLILPSTGSLILFLLLYIVAVGPANYLVLKRSNKRELAWLTIPALVLLFSGFAYLAGFQLKGNVTVLNQMSIAFGQVDSEDLRVQTIMGLYSPRRHTYQLSLPSETLARPFEQAFGALAGGGNVEAVERSGLVTLRNVRVDVSDVQTFVVDSYQVAPSVSGRAALNLRGAGAELSVTVQNNSDVVLETASLLFGSQAFAVGDIGPGETVSIVEPISRAQISSATGSGAPDLRPMPVPAPSVSPIVSNMEVLLGSGDYFNDRALYPRWQLLQSLTNEFGSAAGSYPGNRVSLVAWSDRPQIDAQLSEVSFDRLATSLYILEVPFDQVAFSGQGLTVPETMLDWHIIEQQGAYNAAPDGLLLGSQGWVIFEFEPWQEFRGLRPTSLGVGLFPTVAGSDMPALSIWNWSSEAWDPLGDFVAGRVELEEPDAYLGPDNEVRLRLENNSNTTLNAISVRPVLTGDME